MNKIKNFLKKAKLWLKEVGFTNAVYLILFTYFFITGATFLAGAALGVFVYVNWNVIVKLYDKDPKEIE